MTAAQKTHAERHAGDTQKFNHEDVKIKFSPDMVRCFARLEAAVHDSQHYDGDLLENLRDLTSGKPCSVQMALTEMSLITEETMKHVQATGDTRAKKALDDLQTCLMEDKIKPFTVVVTKARGR